MDALPPVLPTDTDPDLKRWAGFRYPRPDVDDGMDHIRVKIEEAIADVVAGRTIPASEVMKAMELRNPALRDIKPRRRYIAR